MTFKEEEIEYMVYKANGGVVKQDWGGKIYIYKVVFIYMNYFKIVFSLIIWEFNSVIWLHLPWNSFYVHPCPKLIEPWGWGGVFSFCSCSSSCSSSSSFSFFSSPSSSSPFPPSPLVHLLLIPLPIFLPFNSNFCCQLFLGVESVLDNGQLQGMALLNKYEPPPTTIKCW